jgi:probable F420-dependent oxidoreductase
MKIGLFAPFGNPYASPEYVRALGEGAEQRGFDSIWVAEHVVLFDDYESQYPYADSGKFPLSGESGLFDPFIALTYLAACTTTIRLGTGICLLPQRSPVYTAKEAATLDYVSNGRLDLGVGVGWLREEFEALDVPFEHRGSRARAYVDVLKTLWCDSVSQHESEFYSLKPTRQFPKPVQQPYPPIHFGGESDAALRRVADVGQGWYGFGMEPGELKERIARLKELLEKRGRTLDDVEISVCPYMRPATPELIESYREAGVDRVILLTAAADVGGLEQLLDGLAAFVSNN